MDPVRRVPLAEQPLQNWRNGGGRTREVAIDPPGSSIAGGCRWRVSVADVATDGPFSAFPGYDRSLWLLRGDGMLLTLPDREVRLDRPFARLDFAGELPVTARLLGGPTTDLNVFVDRARVRVRADVQQLAAGTAEALQVRGGEQALLLVLGGAVTAAGHALAAGDAMVVDAPAASAVPLAATAATPAHVLLARFAPCAPPADR